MKALVTGGAGFIGSHLVRRLAQSGYEVVVLDNFRQGNKLDKEVVEAIILIEGDVRDESTVFKAADKCDLIFHFAAVLGVDIVADNPVETMETEVLCMKNVVKAAIKNGTEKIIYSSTSGVYGKTAIQKAVDEEVTVSPRSSYSIAKRFNEMYLAALYQEKRLQSTSVRYFNVYGPKQDSRMVIPRFFSQAMKSIPITVYGTGDQTRDFTYIDDVIEATVRVAKIVKGCEILNVSNNREYSIKDVAKNIIKICNSKSEMTFINLPEERYDFEVERRFGCSDKLKAAVDFSPSTPLEIGLEKTYNYLLSKGF
jgi:UDP-glucose 4-epimerase